MLYFPDERTVFSADVLQVKRLPQSITPTIGAYIDALRTIMALDFDHAATGHALMGTKQDAAIRCSISRTWRRASPPASAQAGVCRRFRKR